MLTTGGSRLWALTIVITTGHRWSTAQPVTPVWPSSYEVHCGCSPLHKTRCHHQPTPQVQFHQRLPSSRKFQSQELMYDGNPLPLLCTHRPTTHSYKTRAFVDNELGAMVTVTNKLESTYTYLDYQSQGPLQYVVMAAKDRLDCWASVYANGLEHLPSGTNDGTHTPHTTCAMPPLQMCHPRCGCPWCCPTSPIPTGCSTTPLLCGRSSPQPSGYGSSPKTWVRTAPHAPCALPAPPRGVARPSPRRTQAMAITRVSTRFSCEQTTAPRWHWSCGVPTYWKRPIMTTMWWSTQHGFLGLLTAPSLTCHTCATYDGRARFCSCMTDMCAHPTRA